MRIMTQWQRQQRWVAWDDDTRYYSDDPLGAGRTEAEAIDDLSDQLAERQCYATRMRAAP